MPQGAMAAPVPRAREGGRTPAPARPRGLAPAHSASAPVTRTASPRQRVAPAHGLCWRPPLKSHRAGGHGPADSRQLGRALPGS